MVTYGSKDDVLRAVYASIPEAVDEIVSDVDLNQQLLGEVNGRLKPEERFTLSEFSKRLFALRKRGADKGGLVRKHRSYNGRNLEP